MTTGVLLKRRIITCAVVTRAEAAKQERKISPLKVPDVGNFNVTSDYFKIAQREDPTLNAFSDKAKQTPRSASLTSIS